MAPPQKNDYLLWIDMEMTGLDPTIDEIIEVAAILTDSKLNTIAELSDLIIKQPSERFDRMDAWNQEHHTKSGLWESVLSSNLNVGDAEREVIKFLDTHNNSSDWILCGNSIWQDRRFITRHMPALEEKLNYRMIDISSIKELVKRWHPNLQYNKDSSHRALDDIRESINELKHYQENLFLSPEKTL